MAITYSTTVAGKSYGFDFPDERIDIDVTVDSLLVPNLWTAIKQAMADLAGMPWPDIATGGGTDVLGTGVSTFLTVTLLGNWEINSLKTSGKFEVTGGNLIRADQADPFRDNPAITYISYLSQAGIATTVEVGAVSVDPQVVRDAMKLAPTAGAAATNSVDDILLKTKTLAGLIPATL